MDFATRIRVFLKNNKKTKKLFEYGRRIHRNNKYKNAFDYSGSFDNRQKGSSKLCIVLAGYKEFLYPTVFGRLEHFIDDEIDVCIITSGKFSDAISRLCEKNKWSYLSTKENNVSLVQNVAINLHPHADFIFKLDEDIFITKGFFVKMIEAYYHAEAGPYNPGVMAPLIPINGFGNYRILELKGLLEDYSIRFEKPMYEAGPHRQIENNPLAAEYMWNNINIDELNYELEQYPAKEMPCPIRFSIGAILFRRGLWERMGYFSVDRSTNAMGKDEAELNYFCNQYSQPIMISENIVVGHFSFGPQTERMKQFYNEHPECFRLQDR